MSGRPLSFTRKEAARMLGRSQYTLIRWEKAGLLTKLPDLGRLRGRGVAYSSHEVINLVRRVRRLRGEQEAEGRRVSSSRFAPGCVATLKQRRRSSAPDRQEPPIADEVFAASRPSRADDLARAAQCFLGEAYPRAVSAREADLKAVHVALEFVYRELAARPHRCGEAAPLLAQLHAERERLALDRS